MYYALSDQNEMVAPTATGQRATCPSCGEELISRCGDIISWHWSHKNTSDCDSWSEPKTQWHIDWQDKFPADWREVTIRKDGIDEFHRADVQTPDGTVIEFQHSYLSADKIREREEFYDKMIWVIDGGRYKSINYSCINAEKRIIRLAERWCYVCEFQCSFDSSIIDASTLMGIVGSIDNEIKNVMIQFIDKLPGVISSDVLKSDYDSVNARWRQPAYWDAFIVCTKRKGIQEDLCENIINMSDAIESIIKNKYPHHNIGIINSGLRVHKWNSGGGIEVTDIVERLSISGNTMIDQINKPIFIDGIPGKQDYIWSVQKSTLIEKDEFLSYFLKQSTVDNLSTV